MAKDKKYYGKRPLWQWVVLYLIIGGIVYAALYYTGIIHFGGYKSGGATNSTQNSQYNYGN